MKLMSLLLTMLVALPTAPVHADYMTEFQRTWRQLRARLFTLHGYGKAEKVYGFMALDGSMVLVGAGSVIGRRYGAVQLSEFLLESGNLVAIASIWTMAAGLVIDLFWPVRAHSTLRGEDYKTKDGLAQFLSLPLEEQFKIASEDHELMDVLLQLGHKLAKF